MTSIPCAVDHMPNSILHGFEDFKCIHNLHRRGLYFLKNLTFNPLSLTSSQICVSRNIRGCAEDLP